ncbi:recombinase family protein [Sinorhizobium saheli]|uniref:recombinase family protein n=1 Tax=Sinorhizobium saheli TaxID=36856 RepID=UPI001294DCBE|nr:recombinase family protein [Sinorhizobium saheli]MQW86005.1 helix-turn-helix domain-containing protein [Sinorhizobium saheli]
MIYGYARVSTEGQDLAYQLQKLEAAGCAKIFQEKRSGKNTTDRPQLAKLLKSLEPGDQVLATVTDRIARDPLDMLNILNAVKEAGAGLKLLDEPFIDTTSEMSDLIMFIIGWAAKWQRKRILENTANGRALAKERGVKFGRKPKLTAHQRREIVQRIENGELIREIARSYNVSHSTISRVRP